jgi:hypothetical protein
MSTVADVEVATTSAIPLVRIQIIEMAPDHIQIHLTLLVDVIALRDLSSVTNRPRFSHQRSPGLAGVKTARLKA